MTKKVGYLGGSFDPIHLGHLNLVIELIEKSQLSEALICPTLLSPFKKDKPPHVSVEHRLTMVKLAIEEVPHLTLLEDEIHQDQETYTYNTISKLESETDVDYRLILAEDQLPNFPKWHEAEKLLELAPPLIGNRSSAIKKTIEPLPSNFQKAFTDGFQQILMMDISSTAIRDRLKKNLYCGHLLPRKVLDYICQHRLYYPLSKA